jgi:hypothetical protein
MSGQENDFQTKKKKNKKEDLGLKQPKVVLENDNMWAGKIHK